MKLSVIVPVYKNIKELNRFLKKMADQSSLLFELVFVVDTNSEHMLSAIDNAPKRIKRKINVIYNSKRVGRTEAIYEGARAAKNEYSIIMSTANSFDSNAVKNLLALIKDKQTDIIEFPAKIKEPIKFNGPIRKNKNKSVLIADNEDVVAYTYPFDFNKIFRTRILVESGKLKRLVNVNSRFSIEYVYKAFLVSETYSTSKKAIITSRSLGSSTFNPLKIKRQWTSFEKLLKENYNGKFHPEISYARIFHEMVFLFGFAGVSKNKVLIAKLKKDFEKTLKAEFEDFFITNRYMLIKNKETDLLRKNDTPAKLTKVYKSISNG